MMRRFATLLGYMVILMILLSLLNVGKFSVSYTLDQTSKFYFSTEHLSIINSIKSMIK